MHIDTIARGQTLNCRRTGRTGVVLSVEDDSIRLQLTRGLAKGKRITIHADQKDIRWQKPHRSHLTLRSLCVAR